MTTKNPRINVTLEPNIVDILNMVATRENCSVSSLTKELIIEALERREDLTLSTVADLRDNEPNISHDKAWKDL